MDDKGIIELFFERDDSAISRLNEKYGGACKNVALAILGNIQDAEECINDSYLAVWNTIPPNRPEPLITFLLKIVRNISIRRRLHNRRAKRNGEFDKCLEELDYCIPSKSSVEQEFDALELKRMLEEFLYSLDKTNRIIFIKRYWLFEDYEGIAKDLGMKESAVRTRLSRTRSKLSAFLNAKGVTL